MYDTHIDIYIRKLYRKHSQHLHNVFVSTSASALVAKERLNEIAWVR